MKVRWDWHVHSRHSPCGRPEANLPLICREAEGAGLERIGITDHLDGPDSAPRLLAAREEYDALPDRDWVHFGVEAGCAQREDGEFALYLPEDLLEQLGVRYVIGGVHSAFDTPQQREAVIRCYHRQYMFLAAHARVDIVAHPWWWNGPWRDDDGRYSGPPWFDDFTFVPDSMHDELAAAAREHGTAIEINASAIFTNDTYPGLFKRQYLDYLAYLKETGVTFSLGSDSHCPGYCDHLSEMQEELNHLELSEERLWRDF